MKSQFNTPGYEMFINREESWLGFDRRVLELADSLYVPLGEKMKFAAIFSSNLDEFFMVRVGSLYDQTLLKVQPIDNKTGLTAQGQLDLIMPKVASILQYRNYIVKNLLKKIEDYGVFHTELSKISKQDEKFWKNYFQNEILPLLSPQIIDKRHPFPFLRNLENYVAVHLKVKGDKQFFGVVPISAQFPRVVTVRADNKVMFTFCSELIMHFAHLIFPDMTVFGKCVFRITRNADLTMAEALMEHEVDYRLFMAELLKKRRKLAAIRLETSLEPPKELRAFLLEQLQLSEKHCFQTCLPLDTAACYDISKLLKQCHDSGELFYQHVSSTVPPKDYSIVEATATHDLLLCYPFHSMRPFLNMLYDAAIDPDVVSIKMTLYRLASESKIIDALITAADHEKEVVVMVELRARFDEQNNIEWATRLENSGCTVFYGYDDYKVHSKLCLITKIAGNTKQYISFVGTGNFNESTATLYTDISYITQKEEIGKELASLFHDLSLGRKTPGAEHLLVAPLCFKTEILRQIDREIELQMMGKPSGITVKINSLSDKEIMTKLAEASFYGVQVELIVRGICCMKAGISGVTENIRVTSIVGRYLEHSRIYKFGVGEEARYFIASADFLTRNTQRRVEVGIKIDDTECKALLEKILESELLDNCNSWVMLPDGSYEKITAPPNEPLRDSHSELFKIFKDFDPAILTANIKPTMQVKQKRIIWEAIKSLFAKK